jgi:hypothetical protein
MFCRELESIEELENLEFAAVVWGEMDLPEDYPYFALWKTKVRELELAEL